MAALNPDPGAAPEDNLVMLSGKTFNAIRDALKPGGNFILGEANQISVAQLAAGGYVISFANEKLVTLIQNGAEVNVLIPMRNVEN